MDDSAKYLIHARITADGVVERSDVVGAVFGQTEGLLGDELDLRDLQQSSKIGRIDVQIDSQNGQSFGEITIASGLDKVETSILAASLEAITRVGPCEARVEVADIEDMRSAKRREVVERAKELLTSSFDESVMDSTEILSEVREANRVERIDEYRGLPAGPRVHDSDAIVVVEGRADVLTLLKYGIKNGVAVEGTNVPDAVADLTAERTVTAFLDGDRGGELILKELAQVGDVDYAAFAPEGRSVEDLSRHELMAALREKAPFESLDLDASAGDRDDAADLGVAATDGSATPAPDADPSAGDESPATATTPDTPSTPEGPADSDNLGDESDTDDAGEADTPDDTDAAAVDVDTDDAGAATDASENGADAVNTDVTETDAADTAAADTEAAGETENAADDRDRPRSLQAHVAAVVAEDSNRARLLDADCGVVEEVPAADVFDAVSGTDGSPVALVLDGELSQRVLDVAAQRGIDQIVAESEGEYVKRPASVRVVTADRLLSA
ncbi:DNA primase DnaG [Halobaculum rubrum]|uniref:DNA primase DnaG n=1 Tax=Halobaculum rubrum TaxID=2872158 RepID=UPI001CA45CD8|nr:DNA primase DnaG [Halobaculum rubrum]QZY00104.1 DNA primase [Halobaculum rubrum]